MQRFWVVLCFTAMMAATLAAQSDVRAAKANFQNPLGATDGHLAVVQDSLVFVNSGDLGASFAIDRVNITAAIAGPETLTIRTKDAIHGLTQFTFSLGDPEATREFAASLKEGNVEVETASGGAEAAKSESESNTLTYDVENKRRFGGSKGKLIVGDERITYESITDIGRSRHWDLKDIKEFKMNNPYRIQIKPFTGDNYRFDLLSRGMSNNEYRDIVSRITSKRLER